jgi:hypothetical protein
VKFQIVDQLELISKDWKKEEIHRKVLECLDAAIEMKQEGEYIFVFLK